MTQCSRPDVNPVHLRRRMGATGRFELEPICGWASRAGIRAEIPHQTFKEKESSALVAIGTLLFRQSNGLTGHKDDLRRSDWVEHECAGR